MQQMPLKKLTYADGQALKILVGESIGLRVTTVDTAKQQLEGITPPSSPLMARLDKEAAEIHNQIADDEDMVRRANAAGKSLANSYGFAW